MLFYKLGAVVSPQLGEMLCLKLGTFFTPTVSCGVSIAGSCVVSPACVVSIAKRSCVALLYLVAVLSLLLVLSL